MESLAARYGRMQAEMRVLRNGSHLAEAADSIGGSIPPGPVTLISTSDEGTALAAVCAARRGDGTSLLRVNLMQGGELTRAQDVVIIEPIDVGAAWRQAVERIYPGAQVLILSELRRLVGVAA